LDVDPVFIPALLDWIDEDLDVRYPDGAEEHYETYRVANRKMADASELLLVKNVTAEMYQQLKPYITALPTTTGININTMSETVFMALGEDLNSDAFLQEREEEAFSSVQQFVERLQIPVEEAELVVSTEYFLATGQVVQGDLEYNFETLIHRNNEGVTAVISRTLGLF
ncbi:MAG: general secretion pathway protein GspK, partial [Gammaproteobacteria bacterium]|nr:general secretion pathway protein GspK [Gammaproteobacteria bacterium]